jgi:hypothetical protein
MRKTRYQLEAWIDQKWVVIGHVELATARHSLPCVALRRPKNQPGTPKPRDYLTR